MLLSHKNKTIAVFSDTHGHHRKLSLKQADIAIHLGDACTFGNDMQLSDFFQWFSQYPAKHKIFIAGNHEVQWISEPERFLQMFPKNIIFLENTSIYLEGIRLMSVPARFELHHTPKIKLPEHRDFLLTHAPAKGILDEGLGCPILKKFVEKLKPDYHLFGHIHQTSQQTIIEDQTTYINVSFLKQSNYNLK